MNKNILLILCLMFSLTLVSAETGYGCPQEINFTEVINNSGNIEVVYETSCVSFEDVSVGISVFNDLGGSGSNCAKLNTTYENNTYHITTACTYPEYNENLTFKVSITCPGCTPFPAVLEINNTPVIEEEPEVIVPVEPKKKRRSGGGISYTCEDWTICQNGEQTQSCNSGKVIKTRTCESEIIDEPVEIIQNENGSYVDIDSWDEINAPESNTNEPSEVVEEEPSYTWIWWVIGIVLVLVLILIGSALKD